MKLDKTGFAKLDLVNRLSRLVGDSGFTQDEFNRLSSADDIEKQAFSAYGFAYITWEKSKEASRTDFDKIVVDSFNSQNMKDLSENEKAGLSAFMVKLKRMMLRAFDLGRHDAKISPCPFQAAA